jgi:hypothetical protein
MLSSTVSQSPKCEKLYKYWLSKCVDGRPPSRQDIDPPIEIPELCANLLLFDVMPDGYRFRLVGSENTLRWGVELTGRRIIPGSTRVVRDFLIPLYDQVAADWKPRTIVARMARGSSAKYLLLIMPLVDRTGKTECLFGGSFYEGDYDRNAIEDMISEAVQV